MKAKISKTSKGITVVSQEINTVSSATLGFWINAGNTTETGNSYGISHFLEHMLFKGTKSRSAKQIAEEIENVGGYMNAYTSRNVTAYHAKVLKENVDLAADVLSDMIVNSTFPNEELERERNVVLQEISQTNDDPSDIIFDHFQNISFPNQTIGMPILGTEEIVSKITANDLDCYMKKFYTSPSIVFSVAGNCSHDQALEIVERYTQNIPTHNPVKPEISTNYVGGKFSDKRKELEQTHVILGYKGIESTNEKIYIASLFSSILGGGMSSRLFQEIREKRGLVYSIYSFNSNYRETGLFGVYAATSPEKVDELLSVVCDEINKMKTSITKEEFERTKMQYKANMLMSREVTASICEQNASQTILFGKPLEISSVLDKINCISIDMIEEYANDLTKSDISTVTVGDYEIK